MKNITHYILCALLGVIMPLAGMGITTWGFWAILLIVILMKINDLV